MDNFEIFQGPMLRQHVFQKGPECRDVPLSVSEVVNELAECLGGSYAKRLVKRAARGRDTKVGVQHEKRLTHGIDDAFNVRDGVFQGALWIRDARQGWVSSCSLRASGAGSSHRGTDSRLIERQAWCELRAGSSFHVYV